MGHSVWIRTKCVAAVRAELAQAPRTAQAGAAQRRRPQDCATPSGGEGTQRLRGLSLQRTLGRVGIAVAIQSELDIPVKYIGVGESIDDLQKFNAEQFVNALFDVKTEEEES